MSTRSALVVGLTVFFLAAALYLAGAAGAGSVRPPGFEFPDAEETVVEDSAWPRSDATVPAARARVEVRIEPLARLVVPGGGPPPCVLRRAGTVVDARVEVVAGPRAAVAGGDDPALHVVRFELGQGASILRIAHLPSAGAGVVQLGPAVELHGRVADERGEPVAGATVWAGETAARGRVTATTGADGAFVLSSPGGTGVPVIVRQPGRATAYQTIDTEHVGEGGIAIGLERAAALTVVLAGRLDDPARGRLLVAPASADRIPSALRHYPFFLQAVEEPRRFGADGRAVVDDLPLGNAVAVIAQHPLARPAPPAIVELTRARNQAVVSVETAPVVAGRIADPAGQPLAGALVRVLTSSAARRARAGLLPACLLDGGVVEAHSAADGGFELACEPRETLFVTARGHCGMQVVVVDRDPLELRLPPLPPLPADPTLVLVRPITGAALLAIVEGRFPPRVVAWPAGDYTLGLREPVLADVTMAVDGRVVARATGVAILGELRLAPR